MKPLNNTKKPGGISRDFLLILIQWKLFIRSKICGGNQVCMKKTINGRLHGRLKFLLLIVKPNRFLRDNFAG